MNNNSLSNNEKIKSFWNNCDLHFAHNIIGGHLHNYSVLTKKWEKRFIKNIDFNNKIVLDYGIGGGFLGKYLFENNNIKQYYGIDVSERSIKKASSVLDKFKNFKLFNTNNFYNSFNNKIDIFISQACIQHFPTEKYLIKFLKKINSLNPDIIILQIAINTNNTTKFNHLKYNTIKNVIRACYTTKDFLLKYLVNYTVYHEGKKISNPRKDFSQYLILKTANLKL